MADCTRQTVPAMAACGSGQDTGSPEGWSNTWSGTHGDCNSNSNKHSKNTCSSGPSLRPWTSGSLPASEPEMMQLARRLEREVEENRRLVREVRWREERLQRMRRMVRGWQPEE